MVKDTIVYSESIETYQENGLKRWRRAEISRTIEGDVDSLASLSQLEKEVKTFLHPSTPNPNEEQQPKLKEINIAADRLEVLIENAGSVAELACYFDDALKYGLKNQYDKRVKELQ